MLTRTRFRCDFCDYSVPAIPQLANEFRKLPNSKIECYFCQYYYKDDNGNYQDKNVFADVNNKPGNVKFIIDSDGRHILNPKYVDPRKRKKK